MTNSETFAARENATFQASLLATLVDAGLLPKAEAVEFCHTMAKAMPDISFPGAEEDAAKHAEKWERHAVEIAKMGPQE
jgi:hypothetical protein